MSSDDARAAGTDADADADAGSTDGYVHRPGAADDAPAGAAGDDPGPGTGADEEPPGFGAKGWVLVAAVVLAFLVVPGVIYLRPATAGSLGLPFFATFLVLPFLPALGLGLIAVWSMTAAT